MKAGRVGRAQKIEFLSLASCQTDHRQTRLKLETLDTYIFGDIWYFPKILKALSIYSYSTFLNLGS